MDDSKKSGNSKPSNVSDSSENQPTKRRKQVSKDVRDSLDSDRLHLRVAVWERAYIRLARAVLNLDNDKSDEEVLADPRMGLNRATLINAAYSYFYDVYRAKHFSGSTRINKPKKAAYTIKWLVMEKPIWFIPESFGEDETIEILSGINELYAIRIAMGYAKIPQELYEEKIIDNFVYELSFRKVDEGMISFWFETFMDLHGLPVE